MWCSDWDDVRLHRWCFRQWRSWRRNRGLDQPGTNSIPTVWVSKNMDCFKGLLTRFSFYVLLVRFLMKSALMSPHRFVLKHVVHWFLLLTASLWYDWLIDSLTLFWSVRSYHLLQKVKLVERMRKMWAAGMVSIHYNYKSYVILSASKTNYLVISAQFWNGWSGETVGGA